MREGSGIPGECKTMNKKSVKANSSNKEDQHQISEASSPYSIYRNLRQQVDISSRGYINSRPVLSIGSVSFDIKDMLILGAITGTDCLLTGKTGSGKTNLANLVMKGLFADQYTNKTITPAMQPDDFLDIDFGVMKQGGLLRNAIKPLSILTKPGVILNEVNRAPGVIQNYLIPFLDKEIDIQGKDFFSGVKLTSGERYQFRIITINEGEQYAVEAMDRAIRDRTVIEIPLDMFYQTYQDCLNMLMAHSGRMSSNAEIESKSDSIVFDAYSAVSGIPIADEVILFLTYLSGMSLCNRIKAPIKIKENALFSLEYCSTIMEDDFSGTKAACHFSKADYPTNMNNLCGNVRAPSQRGLLNLCRVSRGVAFIRAAKMGETAVKTTVDDVLTAAPFVLHGKIEMNEMWIKKHYQGNKMVAVSHVMTQAKQRFDTLLHKLSMKALRSPDVVKKFSKKYHDIWALRFTEFDMREKLYRLLIDKLKKGGGEIKIPNRRSFQVQMAGSGAHLIDSGQRFLVQFGDTILDTRTGLIWLKDANFAKSPLNFDETLERIRDWNIGLVCGYDDWRLPTLSELQTLIDRSACSALPNGHPFEHMNPFGYYRSCSYNEDYGAGTWAVNMRNGVTFYASDAYRAYVWPVRG